MSMGLHYNDECSFQAHNLTITDTALGMAIFVIGPDVKHHEYKSNFAHVTNNIMVGTTPWYDCNVDDMYTDSPTWIDTGMK